jgi:hypothetical protein
MIRNVRLPAAVALLALATSACASGGSTGLSRGPSDRAVTADYGAPPDSVMQAAWEVLRNDGVMARSFQRMAGDTANVARMESDWIYVPNVFPAAPLAGVTEGEKYVKLLMWAEPFRGGTRLYLEALYDPTAADFPTEPTNWARLRTLPNAHPSWQYVADVGRDLGRRLDEQ